MSSNTWPANALQRWFFRRLPRDRGEIRLHRKRIYVLPSRSGYLFVAVVALIVIGAMNYGASLGYFTAFLLTGIGLVSILHAFRNLHGLALSITAGEPVFAGQQAHFAVNVHNSSRRAHYMLTCTCDDSRTLLRVIEPGGWGQADLTLAASQRGRLDCGAVKISTVFPLGLVECWSWLKPTATCLVYPAPLSHGAALPQWYGAGSEGRSRSNDNEDFFGFRDYRPGDPLRHIAWRTLARGQPLQTKEFSGESGGDLWLRWNDVRYEDTESRLSQLCTWVLAADAAGLRYGVEIPGARRAPDSGPAHRHACLELLALY